MVPLTVSRPDRRVQPRQVVAWIAGAILAVAALTPLMGAFEDMSRADVTFVNRTRWDVDIDLRVDGGKSRIGLATVRAGTSMTVGEIGASDGERWTFEFAAWDHVARVTMTDRELRAQHYRVDLPGSLALKLEAMDPPASPYW